MTTGTAIAKPPHWRSWTGAEVKRAAAMWAGGERLEDIAAALGRSVSSVSQKMSKDRETFPPRLQSRLDASHGVEMRILKVVITRHLHGKLKALAAGRNMSRNYLVAEIVRRHVVEEDRKASAEKRGRPCKSR